VGPAVVRRTLDGGPALVKTGATFATTLIAAACAPLASTVTADTPPAPSPETVATFLTGDELAGQLMRNVVLVSNLDAANAGAGLMVGARGGHIYVLTASHVISRSEDLNRAADAVSRHFRLKYCDPQRASSAVTKVRVVFNEPVKDVAILEFTDDAASLPVIRALADAKPASQRVVWTIGKEGSCSIGTGQLDRAEDENGILLADLPGGFGGTSGAPISTDVGVIGMVLSNPAAAKVKARSVNDIMQVVSSQSAVAWSLVPSQNKPPGSREDVQMELASSLDNYLFHLKDIRDSFMKEHFTDADLAARITAYNRAIDGFNSVKNKFDGSLERYWGTPTRMSFGSVRNAVADIHQTILGFNISMDKLRQQQAIPSELRRSMTALSPKVDALDVSSQAFIGQLNAGN
jgi:Trypsin-like peptidase domain